MERKVHEIEIAVTTIIGAILGARIQTTHNLSMVAPRLATVINEATTLQEPTVVLAPAEVLIELTIENLTLEPITVLTTSVLGQNLKDATPLPAITPIIRRMASVVFIRIATQEVTMIAGHLDRARRNQDVRILRGREEGLVAVLRKNPVLEVIGTKPIIPTLVATRIPITTNENSANGKMDALVCVVSTRENTAFNTFTRTLILIGISEMRVVTIKASLERLPPTMIPHTKEVTSSVLI